MSEQISTDEQFVLYVVKSMVSYPDDVKIRRSVDELGVLLELEVHRDDVGKVIGKGGQTIKSLRVLLRVVGAKDNGNRVNLRLIDVD
jgi:predicted RNA-binding protein YlqC (UPF0109 family)